MSVVDLAGVYLVLEGPDGCGKSVQSVRLAQWLTANGHEVVCVREPGSTELGEELRGLLLRVREDDLSPVAEALLFTAARREMIDREVAPALRRGAIVVADRCYLSTWVYQGVAGDPERLDLATLRRLTALAHDEVLPDRIFVLDVPVEVSAQRRSDDRPDRIEAKDRAYHERVREGYRRFATSEDNVTLLDATADVDGVHAALVAAVAGELAAKGAGR